MKRRSLSTQGRILAAGVSVALGGALVGFMAAGDHSAASQTTTTSPAAASADTAQPGDGVRATPYDGGSSDGSSGFPTQPQTRTGGS